MSELAIRLDTVKRCTHCGELKPEEAYAKQYNRRRAQCKRCLCAKEMERRAKDPERFNEIARQYRLRDVERYRQRHNEGARRAYARDPSRQRQRTLRWLAKNPEMNRIYNNIRFRRKMGAKGKTTKEAFRARWAYYGGLCWMCGAKAEHMDHVIPLSRGGSNWPSNLRPACAPCNIRKGAKIVTRGSL